MAEYLLLATFITVLSVSTVWTIRTFRRVGKALYQAILPSSKGNIKKAEPKQDLRTLSEELATIPMPWGWENMQMVKVNDGMQMHAVRSLKPKVVPWGWPGHKIPIRGRHVIHSLVNKSAKPVNGIDETGSPGIPDHGKGEAEELPLGIKGNQMGGFHLVTAGQVSIRDARLPWGW